MYQLNISYRQYVFLLNVNENENENENVEKKVWYFVMYSSRSRDNDRMLLKNMNAFTSFLQWLMVRFFCCCHWCANSFTASSIQYIFFLTHTIFIFSIFMILMLLLGCGKQKKSHLNECWMLNELHWCCIESCSWTTVTIVNFLIEKCKMIFKKHSKNHKEKNCSIWKKKFSFNFASAFISITQIDPFLVCEITSNRLQMAEEKKIHNFHHMGNIVIIDSVEWDRFLSIYLNM